jgi:hypothetical protein
MPLLPILPSIDEVLSDNAKNFTIDYDDGNFPPINQHAIRISNANNNMVTDFKTPYHFYVHQKNLPPDDRHFAQIPQGKFKKFSMQFVCVGEVNQQIVNNIIWTHLYVINKELSIVISKDVLLMKLGQTRDTIYHLIIDNVKFEGDDLGQFYKYVTMVSKELYNYSSVLNLKTVFADPQSLFYIPGNSYLDSNGNNIKVELIDPMQLSPSNESTLHHRQTPPLYDYSDELNLFHRCLIDCTEYIDKIHKPVVIETKKVDVDTEYSIVYSRTFVNQYAKNSLPWIELAIDRMGKDLKGLICESFTEDSIKFSTYLPEFDCLVCNVKHTKSDIRAEFYPRDNKFHLHCGHAKHNNYLSYGRLSAEKPEDMFKKQIEELVTKARASKAKRYRPKKQSYMGRFVNEIPYTDKCKRVLLKSAMGTGKSVQVMKLLKGQFKDKTSVWVTPRVLFGTALKGQLKRSGVPFVFYKNHKHMTPQFLKGKCLIIQTESLHHLDKMLADGTYTPEFFIMDESESCLKQFSSPTMKKASDCQSAFKQLMKKCSYVLMSDAFLSYRSINVMIQLTDDTDEILYIKNTYLPIRRKAYCVNFPKFKQIALEMALKHKKLLMIWGSKTKMLRYARLLKDKGIKVKTYYDKSCMLEKAKLDDVSEEWDKYTVVMYTCTITVGIDYNTEIPSKMFDSVFVYGTYRGALPRDLIQGTMRARHLISNTMYYTIVEQRVANRVKPGDLVFNEDGDDCKDLIQDTSMLSLESNCIYVMNLLITSNIASFRRDSAKFVLPDDWVIDLFGYNKWEDNKSRETFTKEFTRLLTKCNYEIINSYSEKATVALTIENEDPVVVYNAIPDVGSNEARKLKTLMDEQLASEVEQQQYYKHQFNELLIHDTPLEIRQDSYIKYRDNIRYHTVVWNLYKEKNRHNNLMEKDSSSDGFNPELDTIKMKKALVFELLDFMKMNNSLDISPIPYMHFSTIYNNFILPRLEYIKKLYNKALKDTNEKRIICAVFNLILGEWCGKRYYYENKNDTTTINGRRVICTPLVCENNNDVYVSNLWPYLHDRSTDFAHIVIPGIISI